MDELIETLTLLQTGKIKDVSVVLIGKAYWEDLINWKKFVDYGVWREHTSTNRCDPHELKIR